MYIDEVNLLDDAIADAILDAAAAGAYTVRRGAMAGTYRSRFVLIGSMNPETIMAEACASERPRLIR